MNAASEQSKRHGALLQDLQDEAESFIDRAICALAAIGAADIVLVQQFEKDGRAEFDFIRGDSGDVDVRERVQTFGVYIVPDSDAGSQ